MNQPLAVDLKSHPLSGVSLIEASAGTGKTFTITHLYVRCLLETDKKINQILVVTFTNAATQELKGRIRQLIYEVWIYLSQSQKKNKQFDDLFGTFKGNKEAVFSLQEALVNFDEAAIFSIHGFCQRILNIFPVETSSLLQQQIIPDERELEQNAIRDYWRKHITDTEISKLRWINSHWKHPDDLLNDVRPLLAFEESIQQLDPHIDDQTLALEWEKLNELWLSSCGDIQAFLLESSSLKRNMVQKPTLLRLFDELQNILSDSIPYNIPDKWPLLTRRKLISCLKKDSQENFLNHQFFTVTENFSELHQEWLTQQKIKILKSACNSVVQSVNETKLSAQNISFNDLIKQLSDVLTAENVELIEKINKLYPLAMVDEFQDTDNKQYKIFKNLYQTINVNDTALIFIGDPKQAIYSFRGADVFTYQQAKNSTKNHFTLETNYRSTAEYINLLNAIFTYNPKAFIYDQLIEFSASKANNSQPKVISDNNKPVTPLVSWIHPFTEKPVSKTIATEFFANQCADEIYTILLHKTLQLDGHDVEAKDLTILVKTGRQASLIKNKLAERGISCALILRDSVFATDQAREISLLLEVLIEPSNISRLCGLLCSDLFSWNANQIFQLQKDNQQLVSLLEQMKEYQAHWQQKGILSMFFKLMEDHQTLQKCSLYMDGDRRLTNWMHIVELLQQQSAKHASFNQVLHWLVSQREQVKVNADNEEHQLRLESDSDLVRIVTIHKSKGLQYPIIFMPFMWDVRGSRNQPESYSYHDDMGVKKVMILDEAERDRWHRENLAEEIRLFYVAITRAIYRCYLGWGFIQGAGSSAIGHCLFADKIKPGKYPQDLDCQNAIELNQPFVTLNRDQKIVDIVECQQSISIEESLLKPQSGKVIKTIESQPVAKEFDRRIQQQWRISSYSQIASSGLTHEVDRPDYDAVITPVIVDEIALPIDELNRFTFYKGAKAGNFLHDILEHQAFEKSVDEKLIQQKCSEYGFEDKWIPCLTEWMADILSCQLGDVQLCQLTAKQKISEMEFYMSSKNFQAETLNLLLHQHGYSRPEQVFNFSNIKGFIKGFIDLVFEFNGKYFIADYKSNYLGASIDCYGQQNCKQAMYEHHYHLQYLVYTLALHRFLKQRIKNYNYERHFGGVYYLFLRGMTKTTAKNDGIYFHKPELSVVEKLDGLFENG